MLPNFIIAGPPKSGTTSLQLYLNRHPDIFCFGEIHYFSDNYKKGIKWYESHFEKWNEEKAVGEKSPSYFYDSNTPVRIKKDIADVKLIFILRNPVDRAHSHFWHEVRKGREENVLDKKKVEQKINNNEDNENPDYLEISKYSKYIKRWFDYFPKKQMFFLKMEELNQKKLKEILEFLEIDTSFDFGSLKKYNIGGSPRSKILSKLYKNKIIQKIPYAADFINRGLNMKRGKYPSITNEFRKKLIDYYLPYNKSLEKLTGLDVSNWNKINSK